MCQEEHTRVLRNRLTMKTCVQILSDPVPLDFDISISVQEWTDHML